MPLTLTLTEGAIPAGTEKLAIAKITAAFLARHRLTDNAVMTPQVTAHYQILPRGTTFAGGVEVAGVWIEWKTPAFALTDRESQQGFFADAVAVIDELSGGRHAKEQIYFNVVHAVDGAWSFNGQALTNAEILAEISAA